MASNTVYSQPCLSDPDEELVLTAQKVPSAFQAIYERWATPIFQYFYFRTGQMECAEDLTSQLFLSAYQALPRYRHNGHFAAWLFAIARNLAKEFYRKQGRELPLEAAHSLPATGDLVAEVDDKTEIEKLLRLIRSLPEEQQELIRLRYVAELSFADMALVLNKREDAIKKSLYRLQARLQSLLEA